jgi:hypothetical protein
MSGQPARGPLDPEMREAELLDLVRERLEETGWLVYQVPETRAGVFLRGRRGFPPIVAVRGGQLLALLVKATSGKVTDDEQTWLARLRRVPGCRAEVLRPADFSTLARQLEAKPPT